MSRIQRIILGIVFFVLTLAAFGIVFASRGDIEASLQVAYEPDSIVPLTPVPTTAIIPNNAGSSNPATGGTTGTTGTQPTPANNTIGASTPTTGSTTTGQTTAGSPQQTHPQLNLAIDPNAGPLSSCDPALYPGLNSADRDYFDRANSNAVDASSFKIGIATEASIQTGGERGVLTVTGDAIINNISSLPRFQFDSVWQINANGLDMGSFAINIRFLDNVIYFQTILPGAEGQWTGISMSDLTRSVYGEFADIGDFEDLGLFDTGDSSGITSIVPYTDFPQFTYTTQRATTGNQITYDSCVDLLGILTHPEFVTLMAQSFEVYSVQTSGLSITPGIVSSVLSQMIQSTSITTQHTISTTEGMLEQMSFNASVTLAGAVLASPDSVTLSFNGSLRYSDFNTAPTVAVPPNANIVSDVSGILAGVPAPQIQN